MIEKTTPLRMNILIVDDSSPDGTGAIVERISQTNKNIFLITGIKQGLGKAYIRGFRYAIDALKADVVMEMDADFSHDPKDVIRLLAPIYENSADLVIGSRYIDTISAEYIAAVENKTNNTPIKCLQYKTPYEMIHKLRVTTT